MTTRSKNFKDEFYFFLNKFANKENFSLLRFSDGELYLLQDRGIQLTPDTVVVNDIVNSKDGYYNSSRMLRPVYDQKYYIPEKHGKFRDYLIASYLYNAPNYYKGISCRCCVGQELYQWQLDQVEGDSDNLTWSNVFLNSNYPLFLNKFYPLIENRRAYVICNEAADLSHLSWVKGSFRVGSDIFDNFERYVIELKNYIHKNNIVNEVLLFSASSLSNVMQYELMQEYPNNTYIDIGTTLSHEFKIPVLRGYILDYLNNNIPNLTTCIW
jgi:hypothetical protein